MKTEAVKIVHLEDGQWEVDGCAYETLADGLGIGVLGTCGCGCPIEALQLAGRLVEEEPEARRETLKGMGLDTGSENALVVGAAFLLMYALDDRGLLEHGGGIMGSWPTERGRQFVKLGKKALAEIREPEEKSQGEKT